jgi:hypothetical protein
VFIGKILFSENIGRLYWQNIFIRGYFLADNPHIGIVLD